MNPFKNVSSEFFSMKISQITVCVHVCMCAYMCTCVYMISKHCVMCITVLLKGFMSSLKLKSIKDIGKLKVKSE